MKKIYDISTIIKTGMMVYKNKSEKQPIFNTITNGHVTETTLKMDVHCGTHVDAPLHMMNDGSTIESVPLEKLVGTCKVLDLTHVKDGITKDDLASFDICEGDFLLFKTSNSFDTEFNFNFIYLKKDGADYLAEKKIRGVGTDALGIERSQPDHDTHRILFESEIVVVEGLSLKEIAEGDYFMVIAPLKVEGIDASPARAFLIEGI